MSKKQQPVTPAHIAPDDEELYGADAARIQQDRANEDHEHKPAAIVPGSGVTAADIMRDLQAQLAQQFEQAVTRMPKAKREAAIDGFKDGMRTLLYHLQAMGVVVVAPEQK